MIDSRDAMDPRYREHRAHIEEGFSPEYLEQTERETEVSPSGKYRLTVDGYSRGPNSWGYSRGTVVNLDSGKVIADIKRNLAMFWHTWIQHANGQEYLLCGEDYQGQSVVNLGQKSTNHYFPDSGYAGGGFCWAAAWPNQDSTILAVEGCFWACPYEVVFYDLSQPDTLPYRELLRIDEPDSIEGWTEGGDFRMTQSVYTRKSDGVPYAELSDDEQDSIDQDGSLAEDIKRTVVVHQDQILTIE